jgi:hypothetical protein
MRLVRTVIPSHIVDGTNCFGDIGKPTAAVSGRVTISGYIPRQLGCSSGAGPVEGHYKTRPQSGYLLTISRDQQGLPFGGPPFLKRSLRITP